MADRTDLLIERNHTLLAQAEAAQLETRQIVAQAVADRLEGQEMRSRVQTARRTRAVLPNSSPPFTLWLPPSGRRP